MPSGFTSTFPSDILPDSAFIGTGANGAFKALGATIDGVDCDPEKELTNAAEGVDGISTPIAGLDRITKQVMTVSCKLVQFGASTIIVPEAGMVSSASSGIVTTLYTPYNSRLFLGVSSLLADLRVVWLRTNGTFFQLHMLSAIVTKYKLSSKDKKITIIDAQFQSRLNLGFSSAYTVDTPPYFYEQLNVSTFASL